MARIKTGNKLNVVLGTKSQIDSDTTIPNNSIIIKTDDNESGVITVEEWNTTTKTLALSDANKLFICSSPGNKTLTVPTNATVAFPIGTMITFLLNNPDKITFVGASGVTLSSMDSLVELATLQAMASLIKRDTNIWHLVGALE